MERRKLLEAEDLVVVVGSHPAAAAAHCPADLSDGTITTHESVASGGRGVMEVSSGIQESGLSAIDQQFSPSQYKASEADAAGLFIITSDQNEASLVSSSSSSSETVVGRVLLQQTTRVEVGLDGQDMIVPASYRVDESHSSARVLSGICSNDDQLPEQLEMIFECKAEEEQQQQVEKPTPSSHCLDDYIDVVTTYKCKFCMFSCAWKSGLKSHIRNCHLNSKSTKPTAPATSNNNNNKNKSAMTKSSRSLLTKAGLHPRETTNGRNKSASLTLCQAEKSNSTEVSEQHIFLCGECSKGFGTFDQCRRHMVDDHQLTLPGVKQNPLSSSEKRPNTGKQEDNVERHLLAEEEEEAEYQVELEEDNNQDSLFHRREGKGSSSSFPSPALASGRLQARTVGVKRMVKTPRELQADFLLDSNSNKKKRDSKENSSDKPYRCSEVGCGCRFLTEANLEYHSQCHAGEDNSFACPECGHKFDQWRRLLLHLWKEHLVDLDLLTCAECGYKTHSQFKLETHQKIHSDVRNYMCSTCGKSFKQLSQLRNHNVMHLDRTQIASNGQKRWYNTQQCETCGRNFSDSKCLRKHQQAVHCKIKPYICNFCGHSSARKAMLQLHMRQHTGERPFSCEHCEYRTGDHNSLRRHRMRHTGSKPYKCPHCTYSCIQAISLKTHLKKKHPGSDGLFSCTLCGFRSVNGDNFAHHMSDHQRGIVPATDKPSTALLLDGGGSSAGPPQPNPQPEGTVQEMVPGNVVSAQLICSCLNVLTREGETVDLPPGCITVGENGTQTITIQIPSNADQETGEQYYFTIQQDLTPGSVTELGLLENGQLKLASEEEEEEEEEEEPGIGGISYGSNKSVTTLQQGGTC